MKVKRWAVFFLSSFAVSAAVSFSQVAWAQQGDEIASQTRQLSSEQTERLRATVNAPVPSRATQSTLEQHFIEKEKAAGVLGDGKLRETVLRQAIAHLPNAYLRRHLADQLAAFGQYDEAEDFYKQAISSESDPSERGLTLSSMIYLLYQRGDFVRLEVEAPLADAQLKQIARGGLTLEQRFGAMRAQARIAQATSLMHQNFGRSDQSIAQAQEAVRLSAEAAALLRFSDPAYRQNLAALSSASSIRRLVSANRVAGRLQDAETALRQFHELISKWSLGDASFIPTYQLASQLRYQQRDFNGALRYAEKVLALARVAGAPDASTIAMQIDRIRALGGLGQYREALAGFSRFDELAKANPKLAPRVQYLLDRGWVHLGLRDWVAAAGVLRRGHKTYSARYGDDHPTTVVTLGLLGVALWEQGGEEQRAQAREFLHSAVARYLNSTQLAAIESQGVNTPSRRRIFETYLESAAEGGGLSAASALGAADWLAGSTVQMAVGDAAVRAAVSTPELGELVRNEQDVRNESLALRRFLAGEEGAVSSSIPQIASRMRERLVELESRRHALLVRIRAAFPDYDRLVRPPTVEPKVLGSLLQPHQAMVVMLPTSSYVYIWAIASSGAVVFHRATLSIDNLAKQVQRLRASVEFGSSDRPKLAFDAANAYALYRELLAPLSNALQDKSELIIAASGPLAQIPFGLLLTDEQAGPLVHASWLIRRTAITHIPSASAWLNLKRIERRQAPAELLAGWGDPAFDLRNTSVTVASTRKASVLRATREFEIEKGSTRAVVDYANIPPLPETRDELVAISRALGADTQRDLILGDRATRDSVMSASKSGLLGRKRVVAFATHGLMAGDLPGLTQPALAMAANGNEKENPLAPLLTLEDVLNLNLNADWVVLSACNTASADGKAEEALSGLARGFFYAGSRSLLVTHWAVESESAVQITTGTFEHYARNPTAPKAESLRQSMLKVMADPKYGHPAFWAPYALVGDGSR